MTTSPHDAGRDPAAGAPVAPRTTEPSWVTVSGLKKSFGDVNALGGIDLDIAHNEFVSVIGPSGCGKSTLLSIIAGLDDPTDGTVLIEGEEVTGPGRDRGVVFQQSTLLPWLTAQRNVEFALRPEGLPASEVRSRAREYLQLVGLEGFEDHYPAQLSGGMQQRVSLARSLSYQPEILLMDEPFGALDALTRRVMQGLLTEIWEKHKLTVLLVTHDIDEAVLTSDRVIAMGARPGRIIEEMHIDIPRPRTPDMFARKDFQEYSAHLLSLITGEKSGTRHM